MQQMKKWILAMKIEFFWSKIKQNRKKMEGLIKQRVPYSSPELVVLDLKNRELWWQTRLMEQRWTKLPAR